MDELPIQGMPLLVFAATLFVLAGLLALRARARAGSRMRAIAVARGEASPADTAGDKDVVQLFDPAGNGPRLAVLLGDRVGVAGDASGDAPRKPLAVQQATLLFDGAGRVGLRIALLGGGTYVAVDLDSIVRLYDRLNEAKVEFQYEVAPGANERIAAKVNALHQKEQAMLAQWLQADKGEVLLDIVPNVACAGRIPTPGSVVKASLVVTNVRLSLLVQTQTVTQSGNTRTTTTHLNLLGYPLPWMAQVVVTRAGSLRKDQYRWSFQWKPESAPPPDQTPPDLLLGPEFGAAVFPLAICKVDVQVRDAGPSASTLTGAWIRGGIGFGILGAILGGVPIWMYWGAGGGAQRWAYDWIVTCALAGALAAAVMRGLSAYEWFQARRAASALVGKA